VTDRSKNGVSKRTRDYSPTIIKLQKRVASLESVIERLLRVARGDGREASSYEDQMVIRTAAAILEHRLK
jgi:hypothetical protein